MKKSEKERVVEELAERLRSTETLIVADYRGLSVTEIDDLRTKLLEHGARFTVVKNTLTRRAAEAAGADALLALVDGPTAIAFLESDGDPVAVAKALGQTARETQVLEVRGGILDGAEISAADVASLAKLPPAEVLRGQLVGAVAGPLTMVVGLFTAPLRDLVGVLEARIRQLEEQGDTGDVPDEAASGSEPQSSEAPERAPEAAPADASGSEPQSAEATAEAPPEEGGNAEDPQTPTADAAESVEAEIENTQSEETEPNEEQEG
jgi:large subunit ribosomal protein L10